MKNKLTLIEILFLLCPVMSIAQNVLIEPSGLTPLPTSTLWEETSGNIQYSSGQVIVGSEAGSDRFTVRADNNENPMRVGVGAFTAMRIFSNGAISLNGNWNNPVSNTTRVVGNLLLEKTIQLGSSTDAPNPGTMRWNNTSQDFEGWNGTAWVSLTRGYTSTGSANTGPPTTPLSQEQQITETGANNFGRSVAISGDFALVGGGVLDPKGFYFYKYDGNTFSLHSSPIPSGGLGDELGATVALLGNRAIVGAPQYDVLSSDEGGAYIFEYNSLNDTWEETSLLTTTDVDAIRLGSSVAISENYAILGAPNSPNVGTKGSGKVSIFFKNNTNWEEQAILPNPYEDDYFGREVAINDYYAFIGISSGDSVYVYSRQGGIWGLSQILAVVDENSASFGESISVSGDYLIIGDYNYANGFTTGGGKAYMYHLDANGNWVQTQEFTPPNPTPYGYFGSDVAISGDYVIIGSTEYNDPGYAVIYHYDGIDWSEIEQLTDPIGQGGGFANADDYGHSVAIDSANRIVGSPRADANGFTDQGKAIIGPVE